MNRRITVLWIQALRGSGQAYRKLGMIWYRGGGMERILAKLCLEKAMERGDEYSFFLYHKYFSKGRRVIDDLSYRAMCDEYMRAPNTSERKKLRPYLAMGTRRQKISFLPFYNVREGNSRKKHSSQKRIIRY